MLFQGGISRDGEQVQTPWSTGRLWRGAWEASEGAAQESYTQLPAQGTSWNVQVSKQLRGKVFPYKNGQILE